MVDDALSLSQPRLFLSCVLVKCHSKRKRNEDRNWYKEAKLLMRWMWPCASWTLELTFRRFMEEFRVSAWRAPQVPRHSSGRLIDSRGARRDVAAEVHATCRVSEAKKEPGI